MERIRGVAEPDGVALEIAVGLEQRFRQRRVAVRIPRIDHIDQLLAVGLDLRDRIRNHAALRPEIAIIVLGVVAAVAHETDVHAGQRAEQTRRGVLHDIHAGQHGRNAELIPVRNVVGVEEPRVRTGARARPDRLAGGGRPHSVGIVVGDVARILVGRRKIAVDAVVGLAFDFARVVVIAERFPGAVVGVAAPANELADVRAVAVRAQRGRGQRVLALQEAEVEPVVRIAIRYVVVRGPVNAVADARAVAGARVGRPRVVGDRRDRVRAHAARGVQDQQDVGRREVARVRPEDLGIVRVRAGADQRRGGRGDSQGEVACFVEDHG